MNINFVRHRRMLSHLCRIRVLWFPLKQPVIALCQFPLERGLIQIQTDMHRRGNVASCDRYSKRSYWATQYCAMYLCPRIFQLTQIFETTSIAIK